VVSQWCCSGAVPAPEMLKEGKTSKRKTAVREAGGRGERNNRKQEETERQSTDEVA